MAKTVVGLFDHLSEAKRAVEDLVDSGFERDNISLVANASADEYDRYFDEEGRYDETYTRGRDDDNMTAGEGASAGAGIGATIGGIGGLLMGLGLLAVPGVGPALAAGPIVSTLVGAGIGGVAGGLLGALVSAGVPEEHAHAYAEGVRRGGTLVTVQTADERADRAADILNRHHPVDIEERVSMWQDTEVGYEGFDRDAQPYTAEEIRAERDELDIPVIEEEMRVGKRDVERGGVRVRSYMTEKPFEEQVRLRDESVHVDRRPVDRPASEADFDSFREGTTEVTETDEEAVVEKRPHVVEEVHVGKDARERTETVRDTVRRTDVDIEEIGVDRSNDDDFARYEPGFREHFGGHRLSGGYSYDQARPAYRYGYSLANTDRYRDRDWNEIEAEARRQWEERNEGTWEDFREPVRYSYDEARRRR